MIRVEAFGGQVMNRVLSQVHHTVGTVGPEDTSSYFPSISWVYAGENTRQWPDIDIGILTQNGLLWEEGPMMMEALDLTFLTKRVNQEQIAHPCGNPEITATTHD